MTESLDRALYATDRRTLVLVDAGFVLGVMRAHHGVESLADLEVDALALIGSLVERAEETLGCPVLRTHWYDAVHPSGDVPNLVVSAVGRVPGVKLRLGTLTRRGDGGWQQKAVDTLVVRDMIAQAYKRTFSEMVLLSGDADLSPGVEEAQEQGVRVHLWSLGGADLPPSVARSLVELADTHTVIDAGEVGRSIHTTPSKQAPSVPLTPTPQSAPAPVTTPTPTPLMVARRESASVYSADSASFPILFDLNRNEYNSPVAYNQPAKVGTVYAERWWAYATVDERTRMLGQRDPGFDGTIPRDIDADLLAFGSDHGLDTWGKPWIKKDLRKGFWEGMTAAG